MPTLAPQDVLTNLSDLGEKRLNSIGLPLLFTAFADQSLPISC
jgi:hypothetical protein